MTDIWAKNNFTFTLMSSFPSILIDIKLKVCLLIARRVAIDYNYPSHRIHRAFGKSSTRCRNVASCANTVMTMIFGRDFAPPSTRPVSPNR